MPPIDGTEALGMGAIAFAASMFVEHLKPVLRTLPGFRGENPPWALVVDLVAVTLALWTYYAGHWPSLSNGFEAALVGFLAAVAAQGGYKTTKAVSLGQQPRSQPVSGPLPNRLEQ